MIAAHIIWGITLGVFVEVMRQEAEHDTALTGAHAPHHDVEN
jgi:hypothetical protein